jgi:hypothetical protein
MKKNTEKAVRRIPQEINRLSRVVAAIGETLIDGRIRHIRADREAAKSVVPKGKMPKRGRK